ncbi:hypothetical protein P43SY_002549 [Pythium insidiosum]|uniref:Uncharacterized protein n=1 Tax=Pythium insidiosum TaxID=114742 RepID=A0AAD5QAZ2_PYTIN|nr:hypothetical protein P43SY_002549 [Pythium insidiosum]
MSNHDPTIYTLLLTIACLALLVFTLTRLLLSMRNKNKLLSWSTCFYVLCLMWTVVRSTYWIMIQTRESMTYLELYLLYWFPTPIQFANFSLLILFYIQVITGKKWRSRWRNICLPLYFLLTMSMATFTAVWAFNSSNDILYAYEYGDEYDEEFYKVSYVSVQLEYSAISFFMLSFLFGFFGWKMANFLPTILLLCLITTKAGGVGAPRHASSSGHKLPDFGIFHIINVGGDKAEGKLLASPLNSSYGTASSSSLLHPAGVRVNPHEAPRWTHGGDLFLDPLRYDSDDGAGPSPRHFPDSFNSDASSTTVASYERRSSVASSFAPA